jgi:chromosome partitioning protein
MQTKVIAIVSEKGGAGKTSTTINLACALEQSGHATVIFDLDPRANSAVWGDARSGQPPEVIPAQVARLELLLAKAKQQGAEVVILDTPGNALAIAEGVCKHADLILVPCRPSPPDLVSVVPTVKTALAASRPAFVVINAAPVQGSEVAEAIAAINRAGVSVCPVVLYARKSFVSRFHEGLGAIETDPKGKAADEARSLSRWAVEQLNLNPKKLSHVQPQNQQESVHVA